PWRLRIPLIGKVQPERRLHDDRFGGEAARTLDLLGEFSGHRIGDVDLAPLECREPRRLVWDQPKDQALHVRDLAPILVECFDNQLLARREGDEFVRPGPDRRLLEAVFAHPLDVFLWHDPARTGRAHIIGEKVRPRLLELEADVPGIADLDRGYPLLEQLVRGTAVALEAELDVLGRNLVAVM